MRKLFMLPIVIAGLLLDSGAFAATNARGGRGGNSGGVNAAAATTKATGKASSVRAAATRGVKKSSGAASAGGVKTGSVGVKSNTAAPSGVNSKLKRAAATQKVVQAGTKVGAKTEDTTVSDECKDAFFGCMDSLCMVDNASGGRCMCSDKINDYNKIQEEILKLDEQSYIMATEGVERLKMGENADEILARAKAAGDAAANKKIAEESNKKVRTFDLTAWNQNVLFDDDDEDIFKLDESEKNSLLEKTGDALYKVSIQMCAPQIPSQCQKSASMLQMMYAQKIKSDCTAYENSLKQQKSASTQKLQTAQKALRDTALEEFQNENKYDLGQCTLRFTECMQTTAGCEEDFTGCVTLAAAENVKTSAQSKQDKQKNKQAKQTTIKGAVSSITLAASTIDQMTAKKPLCESVLKQCKKVQDKVWDTFMANIAPTLKSAELIAEDNLRSNCISDVSDCFQKACKEYMDPKNPNGSYDMCLSDPMLVVDLCKVKLEPCINATGGTLGDKRSIENSRLWKGVTARLEAMRADACTSEIKSCLMSDDICGKDYSKCVGLDTSTIGYLCPAEKLTACMSDNNYKNETAVRDYVARVAQGIALNIDNEMLTTCQKAADAAMIKVCGDSESCPNLTFDDQIFKDNLNVQVCNGEVCRSSADGFADNLVLSGEVLPTVTNMFDLSAITFETEEAGNKFVVATDIKTDNSNLYYNSTKWADSVVNQLNASINSKFNSIKSDPTVAYCMEGRKIQGFDGSKFGRKKGETTSSINVDGNTVQALGNTGEEIDAARFPNLLNNKKDIMVTALFENMSQAYTNALNNLDEKREAAMKTIETRLARIDAAGEDAIDKINANRCTKDGKGYTTMDPHHKGDTDYRVAHSYIRQLTDDVGSYDVNTNICTVNRIQYNCTEYLSPSCRNFDSGTTILSTPYQMDKYSREDNLNKANNKTFNKAIAQQHAQQIAQSAATMVQNSIK